MAGKRDYYEVLGLERDAAPDEIKKAYRKLAIKLHPDRNKEPDAADRFKEVSEAYAILSDQEKRSRYDQLGHAGIDQQYSTEDIFRGVNFNDIFGGGFGSIFDTFFGGRQSGPSRGRDLQVQHAVSLEEAFTGVETELSYPRLEICDNCNGTAAQPDSKVDKCGTCRGQGQVKSVQRTPFGAFQQVSACPDCQGAGKIIRSPCRSCSGHGQKRAQRTVSVKIPAGIADGQSLRVHGQGEVGTQGGPHGDLYVMVRVKAHDYFVRDGGDLYLEQPISIPQAVLGTKVRIATLDGAVTVQVPPGSETGQELRVRGRGMPLLRRTGRGDLRLRLRIIVPAKISDKVRDLLEEMAEELDVEVEGKRGLFGFLKGK